MPVDIDTLPTQKSLIDFSELPKNSFDSVFMGYNLKAVLDDILLVQLVDETEDGTNIMRNGLLVPINAATRAWRIGKVIIAGPNVKLAKSGEYVCFPNNMGVPIANIDVEGYGLLKKGVFLNEQRIFGICSIRENEHESVASHVKKSSSKQRR
jgi:hypothetical protein